MTETIRVLIADDHAIVREGLRGLIATEPGLVLVAEASDGQEAVTKALEAHPDVVLLDLVMPHMDGLQAMNQIRQALPETRFLILTSFSDDARVFATIRSGAMGYLLKDSSPQDLLKAIREVYRGQAFLNAAIAHKLIRKMDHRNDQKSMKETLTSREQEVLRLMAEGLSNQAIADSLAINERTVRTHVSSILSKLDLQSRTQAVLYALREGLAKLDGGINDGDR